MNRAASFLLCMAALLAPVGLHAQGTSPLTSIDPLPTQSKTGSQGQAPNPLATPEMSPGQIELLTLEARFAADVAKGGGKAFASWFADDAVALNNGQPAKLGKSAIAATADWDANVYQLTWRAEGAQMGPAGDTGFTWGHYEATSRDGNGQPVTSSGRYITFWKKVNSVWKVALDASANDAPAAGDCCSLPKP